MKNGFTLVEALIVMALIGILAAIAIPNFSKAALRAKEATLRENLHAVRSAINYYYFDKKKYPAALEDLVISKYLREIPVDPMIKKKEWNLIHFEPLDMEEYTAEAVEGIIDIKSLSTATALDGTPYGDW